MPILRRILRACHTIPEWGVRSIAVLDTAPWRESGATTPEAAQGPSGLATIAPLPTPTQVVVATKRPSPAPLSADGTPSQVADEASREPVGFPPLETYAQGLRPEFQSILADQSHLTRYDLSVELFPDRRMLEGRAAIALRNNSENPWSSIVFRLPTNRRSLGSKMHLGEAAINGLAVQPVLSSTSTVTTLPLASPLEPGQWVRVEISWHLDYIQLADEGAYVRNRANQDMINLPHFYPELAVYAPGAPGTNTEGWWTQKIPSYADMRFHDIALMTVAATTPSDLVVVGSGTPVHEETVDDGRMRRQWVTGPVRGFVLQASPLYQVSSRTVAGVRVQSFHHAADAAVALRALDQAAQALGFFSEA